MLQSVMKVDQIIGQYPASYVLLDSCKFNEEGQLTSGRVILSSAREEDVYKALHKHPNSLIIFTGPAGSEREGAYLDRGAIWQQAVEA